MKRLTILAFLLCLCLLASCTALPGGSGSAQPEQAGPADVSPSAAEEQLREESTPADADESPVTGPEEVPDEPQENVETEEPIPASAGDAEEGEFLSELPLETGSEDYSQLSAADCLDGADAAVGALPRIAVDCPGAQSINEDIQETFGYLLDADYCTVYYESFKNGNILSVLVVQQYDDESCFYNPYNLDLATGQRIGGEDLLAMMEADRTVVGDSEIGIMAEEFEHQFGSFSEGDSAAFYQEQYERTTSTDNTEFSRLWIGGNGQLWFVAKLYPLAGAEFYEYPMCTGISF